jgi:hypothetical protein
LRPAAFDDPELFTGEHVYSWMLEDYGALRRFERPQSLTEREWPRLYDPDRLARSEVPVEAVVYADDMYVDRELSEETGRRVRGLSSWLTSEYDHDGLRVDGERILGRLIELARRRL